MILGCFAHAFVINLPHDRDRLFLFQQRAKTANLIAEPFPAIVVTEKKGYASLGAHGCALSHWAILKEAKRRNLPNILIMEDDAVFRLGFKDTWEKLKLQIDQSAYDILFGYDWFNSKGNPDNVNLVKLKRNVCFHFYAISSKFYDRMLDIYETNYALDKPKPCDLLTNQDSISMYAPDYNLVGQDSGESRVENAKKVQRWHA